MKKCPVYDEYCPYYDSATDDCLLPYPEEDCDDYIAFAEEFEEEEEEENEES